MMNFNFYQDCKVEVWKRIPFTVEAETKEEAEKIASSLNNMDIEMSVDTNEDIKDIIRVETDDIQYVLETEEIMYPKENGGQCTIEVFSGSTSQFRNRKLSDNTETDKNSLLENALDAFYDAISNYAYLVKERLQEQGGKRPVFNNVDMGDNRNACLSLSRIDDNSMNVEVLLIDAVRVDENNNLFYHVKERDHEETDEWVEMVAIGTDEMYILQNILWK